MRRRDGDPLTVATSSPLEGVHVSLDLETTGLDPQRDDIIEAGAVKFRGAEVLESYESLVNPRRTLPKFITEFTGITQREVDTAPPFSEVAGPLLAFLGQSPLVGHNVAFDLAFLARAGISLPNRRYDTQELASVFIPAAKDYSLTGLARALDIPFERPHRALEDSRICHRLFIALVQRALKVDPRLLAALSAIADRSPWALRELIRQLERLASGRRKGGHAAPALGILGLDMARLRERLGRPKPMHPGQTLESVDLQELTAMLGEGGALARAFPNYEYRPQQVQMAQAVTEALNKGKHLMVEAGTGVGKSVAYLLPAMLFAARNGRRIVVSTNTINLQEQLINKDIPALLDVLQGKHQLPPQGLRFCLLKGRGNYLCFRRWAHLAQSDNLVAEDARMVCKSLVWLQETGTGDRAEMNIPPRDSYLWDRLSAQGAGECDGKDGMCFLRAARAQAEAAHIVVVNHALLLSDLATGGSVIQQYDHLVVDEAHHLEEEASRQFGYEVSWQAVGELATRLTQHLRDVGSALGSASVEASRRDQVAGAAGDIDAAIPRLREAWDQLMSLLADFAEHHRQPQGDGNQLRITLSTRKQPDWSGVEAQWERFNEAMVGIPHLVDRLLLALEPLEYAPLKDPVLELRSWQETAGELRGRVESFVIQPDNEYVYWVSSVARDQMPVLHAVPLKVASRLGEVLFAHKRCVVLTSATLSVEGKMKYMRERLGAEDADELIVGSPFDYQKAALVLVPSDMPEPADLEYQQALEEAMVRVARASGGGVLGLFTSHAALRATRREIRPVLESEGIAVLAQGVDGSPRQLQEAAMANSKTVLLGTSSLWEGVDLSGDALRVVMVARLPFSVPSDPVFAARSEQFTDPFNQYAVPQAVLRFRQGFGRLIRSKSDRGVVVVLDRRALSKGYGAAFLRSLPRCTVRQ
ncbi:MAG: DEAD/DEAH box helicase family protein, partial [Chloroflexi bacterium]|nr:DEAD/DEAH box helicase family protein [Chloroflexota bacterium]